MLLKPGEKCLAFHGPLLYEAKVLRAWNPETQECSTALPSTGVNANVNASTNNNNNTNSSSSSSSTTTGGDMNCPPDDLLNAESYYIHYKGWKASWDEWVGVSRVRDLTPANKTLQQKLAKEARASAKSNRRGASTKKNKEKDTASSTASPTATTVIDHSPSPMGSNGMANNGMSSGTPNGNNNGSRITLHMPIRLKAVLVNDWEYVTKDKMIVKLPPKLTIHQIMENYLKLKSDQLETPVEQSQLNEFILGLKLYFNKSLPVLLLYRLERLQFNNLIQLENVSIDNIDFTKIYGCIHLLRLLSLLPELISMTTMDTQNCTLLISHAENLLLWLLLNNTSVLEENGELPTIRPRDRAHRARRTDTTPEQLFFDEDHAGSFYVNTSSQYEGVALGM
ncbi:hypothetical protein TBLA_0G02770 [Henningerozyma blattae CBS 6284]|uniref:Chromatin modification-related protein EAF3 n=1 Tax=Henningerozyma blattae (strain ATCC 34711 / CBS 6284 / DSM 70876 / NBRC 10599 / NRRL Y-10934 / UCD 77-7) TaxID=1071380 RepID=I2H763_HENB6|nr:hypothetical protein TBLA_0G02770 [Tetrapisispora blattae CBS 6284]CCH62215.1 hypothetical protein TBLA_0G02770 [Tetrapisispora blattae CBS 6284]